MAKPEFRILVASDGSLPSVAATVTAAHWPWPEPARAFGIVAEPRPPDGKEQPLVTRAMEDVRTAVERALERRWPDVRVWRYTGDATAMILRQAQRTRADLIVMGWRGHGPIQRLLTGSVSRGVVRHASCSVLVVRRASRELKRVVVGYDGSANARQALDYLARLLPAGTKVTIVTAIQTTHALTGPLIPAESRATMLDAVARENAKRIRDARRASGHAAKPLRRAGVVVEHFITERAPLDALLDVSRARKADLLVVGATGATGLRGLLLGSVAHATLDRSQSPVLIVRNVRRGRTALRRRASETT